MFVEGVPLWVSGGVPSRTVLRVVESSRELPSLPYPPAGSLGPYTRPDPVQGQDSDRQTQWNPCDELERLGPKE